MTTSLPDNPSPLQARGGLAATLSPSPGTSWLWTRDTPFGLGETPGCPPKRGPPLGEALPLLPCPAPPAPAHTARARSKPRCAGAHAESPAPHTPAPRRPRKDMGYRPAEDTSCAAAWSAQGRKRQWPPAPDTGRAAPRRRPALRCAQLPGSPGATRRAPTHARSLAPAPQGSRGTPPPPPQGPGQARPGALGPRQPPACPRSWWRWAAPAGDRR